LEKGGMPELKNREREAWGKIVFGMASPKRDNIRSDQWTRPMSGSGGNLENKTRRGRQSVIERRGNANVPGTWCGAKIKKKKKNLGQKNKGGRIRDTRGLGLEGNKSISTPTTQRRGKKIPGSWQKRKKRNKSL